MSKKGNLKRILLCVFVIALSLTFISWVSSPSPVSIKNKKPVMQTTMPKLLDSVCVTYSNDTENIAQKAANSIDTVIADFKARQDSIKEKLLDEVNKYIHHNAPKVHETVPSYIVEKCLTSDIDICFMMSQTQNETNFGTTGAGRSESRKSLFGVCKKTYSTYTSAIDDYVNILQKSYLTGGRTEKDLMNNYVNKSGYRYASSRSYETHLRNTYNGIKAKTKIYELQQQYKKLS